MENHHRQVPFHLLKEVPELSVGDPGSGNLLVEGDNLLALKALLPYYAGQVKFVCVDPPYNTGNENWIYNDNVNSPEMRTWLNKTVGREGEDLTRHDKWLCMMYPRLFLLRQMLCDDGVLAVNIDDNEVAHLRLMLDEIFGPSCFVGQLIWKSRQHLDSRSKDGISHDHEYILVYSRFPGRAQFRGKSRDRSKYKNPDSDPRGPWMSRSILGLATADQRPNLHYDLVNPETGLSYPCAAATGWRYSRETMNALIAEGRILFPKKLTGRPREKVFEGNLQTAFTGFPSIIDGVYTDEGTATMREIFGKQFFAFPKAPSLIRELVQQIACDEDSIVLDSFSGSGTTGHAVMQLNREDGGNRRFILVEMDSNICRNVTAERLKRVCSGYDKPDGKNVEGLGGGFRFTTLGEPLFDERGNIKKTVKFPDLARHVYFTETGEPLPKQAKANNPLIGVCNGIAVYLLYNGILKDKTPDGGNVLTTAVLADLPKHDGPKVIYGTACRIGSERLRRENIVFKQLPYKLRVDAL